MRHIVPMLEGEETEEEEEKRKRRRKKKPHSSSLPDCGPTASCQNGLGFGLGFSLGLGFGLGRTAVSSPVSQSCSVFPHRRDREEMFH